MKYSKGLIGISLIFLVGLSFLLLGTKDQIKERAIGKITEDNKDYLVVLTGGKWKKYGKEVVVFSLEEEKKEIYRENFSEFNPWKIAIGDIDGDGIDEVSIGVYKKSPLHQVMAKRPFIYSFINGRLEPKWRGSRLSRPFTDYNFYDIDGDGIDEIVSIEILKDNRKLINTYKWKGFGFEGYLETKDYEDIIGLKVEEEIVYIRVTEGKEEYVGFLRLQDNNLTIEGVD